MSSKKKIAIAAGLLVGLGAVATVAAQGYRGGWHHGGRGMGPGDQMGMGQPGDGDMRGRGWFNRSLTKDEFEGRTRERFARLDKNSDGVIDAAEIEAALTERQNKGGGWMRQRMGRGGSDQMGNRQPGQMMLDRFDGNKDGKVTKDEFLAKVKERFAQMDLNNDGKITDEDLPPMMRGRNVLAGGDGGMGQGMGRGRGMGGGMGPMSWLRGADANKDGMITLEEAQAAATKQFDQFDRTKDGAVDKADFDAMKKEMTDYRVKRFIHAYGADKDGKVTKDQFFAKARERFASMDRNNDGTIGRDEMPGRRGMGGHGMRGGMGRDGGHMGGPGAPGMMGPGGPGMGGNPPAEPKKN